jgi:hypothetical protein
VATAEDSSNIRNFKGASQQQRDLIDADTFGTNTPFSAYQFEASVRLPFGRIHATSTLISQASPPNHQPHNKSQDHQRTLIHPGREFKSGFSSQQKAGALWEKGTTCVHAGNGSQTIHAAADNR